MHTEAQLKKKKKKGKKENHRKIKPVEQTGRKRWNENPRQSLHL